MDLSDELAAELIRLKKQRQEELLRHGMNTIPEWVFTDECGERIKPTYHLRVVAYWRSLEKAGLRRLRIHCVFRTILNTDSDPS